MAVSATIYAGIKRALATGVDFLHYVGMLRREGIPYDYDEVGEGFSKLWDSRQKSRGLQGLSPDTIPGTGEIFVRPMKQRARYHAFGWVNVYNTETEEMVKLPQHVYTDELGTVGEYNQTLLDGFRSGRSLGVEGTPQTPGLIVSAELQELELNEGWLP